MRRRHSHADQQAEINITPMLDIIFILLIFFIVTSSFLKESGVEATRAQGAAEQRSLSEIIPIEITSTGSVRIAGRAVELAALRASIEIELAGRPGSSVVVIPGRDASAGLLVSVMDKARLAGAGKVALAESGSAQR